MNRLSFNDLLTQAYQLYQAGEYVQAFDLLTRLAGRFPTEAHTLYFWRICLTSRMDRTALALQPMCVNLRRKRRSLASLS